MWDGTVRRLLRTSLKTAWEKMHLDALLLSIQQIKDFGRPQLPMDTISAMVLLSIQMRLYLVTILIKQPVIIYVRLYHQVVILIMIQLT